MTNQPSPAKASAPATVTALDSRRDPVDAHASVLRVNAASFRRSADEMAAEREQRSISLLDERRDPIDVAVRESRASGERLNAMIARLEQRVETNGADVAQAIGATAPQVDAAATSAEVARSRSRLERDLPRLAAELASLQSRVAAAAGALDDADGLASLAIALEEICNPVGMLSEQTRCELTIAAEFVCGKAHIDHRGDFVFPKAAVPLDEAVAP